MRVWCHVSRIERLGTSSYSRPASWLHSRYRHFTIHICKYRQSAVLFFSEPPHRYSFSILSPSCGFNEKSEIPCFWRPWTLAVTFFFWTGRLRGSFNQHNTYSNCCVRGYDWLQIVWNALCMSNSQQSRTTRSIQSPRAEAAAAQPFNTIFHLL